MGGVFEEPGEGDDLAGDAALAWHMVDTARYNVNLYHFAYGLKKPTSNVLFWIVTVVESPREMTGVRLATGSNAASTSVRCSGSWGTKAWKRR